MIRHIKHTSLYAAFGVGATPTLVHTGTRQVSLIVTPGFLIAIVLILIAFVLCVIWTVRLRRVSKMLRRGEIRNQTIIDSLPVGVEVYSKEGALLSLNDCDCAIFGVDRNDVLAAGITIANNPNLPDNLKQAFIHKQKGHADLWYDFKVVQRTAYYDTTQESGVKRISCTGTPVLDRNGDMVNYVFIVDDITDKYRQEKKLEESKRLSDMAIRIAGMALWKYDNCEKLFSAYNTPLNGYDRSVKLSVASYLDVIHPDDRTILTGIVEQMDKGLNKSFEFDVRTKMSGDEEWQYCTLTGAPFSINEKGNIVEYTGFRRNNTRWKKLNDELRKVNQQNELVLNNTNSGLVYISPDYVVQWENLSVCSASLSSNAYKKGEICYKSTYGLSAPCEDCVMKRALESGLSEQRTFEMSERILEATATPVLGENGLTEGVVIRLDDITERQRMIAELRTTREEAIRSDKLKSAFLANMSHEIRTPLNAIIGFSDLLMQTDDHAERTEYNNIIVANNELLLRLINDILNLSKIEAGFVDRHPEEFDLAPYFDDLCTSVRQRITNPQVEFIPEKPYSHCVVYMDRNRFAQVIMNYATNAIKYTSKGTIRMGYEYKNGGIRLYVSDSGIGISEEKKSRVYQRFEKLDEFAQGTGLGLSIAKALTESSGGQVGFESEEGVGSTFWSWVPTKAVFEGQNPLDGNALDNKVKTAFSESGLRRKILVVEDIESNFKLISAILHNQFDLTWALNGFDGVEKARGGLFDLILMDMKMPKMNGLEATENIRQFDRTTPIVALTAHAFDSDKEAALVAGCNDYLVKPVNKKLLFETLEKWLSGKQGQNIP